MDRPERVDTLTRSGLASLASLPRNVWLLGVVSLLTDVSSEMVYPILPLFLTVTLGAPAAVVGLIEGIAESTASLLKVGSGWYSDRIARRRGLVWVGYGLSALAKPLLALAGAWPVVLLARFVDRTGKGIRTSPRDALIADSTPDTQRGLAFGLHRALDTTGAIVGPLLALAVLGLAGADYRLVFLLALVPAALGFVTIALVREPPRQVASRRGEQGPSLFQLSPGFRAFLLVSVVFALGNSSDAFLILRAQNLGLTPALVILAYVVFNAAYALASLPAGHRSDVHGRRNVVAAGFLVFAGVYGGFALATGPAAIWLLFAFYGLYMGLTDGVGKAYVVDLVQSHQRGTALGLYYTATGLAALVASLVAGVLWDLVGPFAPFALGATTALAAAALLLAADPLRPAAQ
ncbi:MAG: MFS transporter [Chloroflexi bacterium]|nr:MFS transporter [Chloroflexota bacterium]